MPSHAPAPAARVPGSPITPATPYLQQRIGQERSGRPIEPWKDSLRVMMFLWGGILLLAFVTPIAIEPDLAFHWNTIIDAEGTAKLLPLLIAATGLLSILLAMIPMSPPPRGLIAGLLGLAAFITPQLLALFAGEGDFGLLQILTLVSIVGVVLLLPGLLIRNEYRESIAGRIMATLGALCIIALYVIPIGDTLGIVAVFDTIIDGEGTAKIGGILKLLPIVIAVLSLLVWLPAPSTGLAKIWAWAFILLVVVELLTELIIKGNIGTAVKGSPYGALMSWAPESAYYVLIAYGFATIIGKKLE